LDKCLTAAIYFAKKLIKENRIPLGLTGLTGILWFKDHELFFKTEIEKIKSRDVPIALKLQKSMIAFIRFMSLNNGSDDQKYYLWMNKVPHDYIMYIQVGQPPTSQP
jgi:hypothetical protein